MIRSTLCTFTNEQEFESLRSQYVISEDKGGQSLCAIRIQRTWRMEEFNEKFNREWELNHRKPLDAEQLLNARSSSMPFINS
jgi:hypothetical protein